MKLLVSCQNKLILVNLTSKKYDIVESHRPCYYGITWSNNKLILTHSATEDPETDEEYLNSQVGYISVGSDQSSACLSLPHQALSINDNILVANTGRNCITIFDTDLKQRNVWLDNLDWDRIGDRKLGSHFNSFHVNGNNLYVVAHNWDKTSYYLKLSWPELDILEHKSVNARMAHNIWVDKDEIIICNSARYSVIDARSNRHIYQAKGLTRGLASNGKLVVIGDSFSGSRYQRKNSTSRIIVLDKTEGWSLVDEMTLENVGCINDIRLLDEPDVCHNSVVFSSDFL